LEIDLPPALAHLANVTAHGVTRYRFDAKADFGFRREEWLHQVACNRAVAYTISCEPKRGRVYLDASFTLASGPSVPSLPDVLADLKGRV
jgi:hypothetical protein